MGLLRKIKGKLVSNGALLSAAAADFNPFYPAMLVLKKVLAVITPTASVAKSLVIGSVYKYAYRDDATDAIRLLTPAVTLSNSMGVATPTASVGKTPVIGRGYDLLLQVLYAQSYVNPTYTVETTAANNNTANDMHLMPASPAVGNIYYFGSSIKASLIQLQMGTAGAGVWTIVYEYWDGAAWQACVGIQDGSSGFTVGGLVRITHTPQAGWAQNAVNSLTAYWLRARVSAFTSKTVVPLGTQAWMGTYV